MQGSKLDHESGSGTRSNSAFLDMNTVHQVALLLVYYLRHIIFNFVCGGRGVTIVAVKCCKVIGLKMVRLDNSANKIRGNWGNAICLNGVFIGVES